LLPENTARHNELSVPVDNMNNPKSSDNSMLVLELDPAAAPMRRDAVATSTTRPSQAAERHGLPIRAAVQLFPQSLAPQLGAKDPPKGGNSTHDDAGARRQQVRLHLYRLTVHPLRQRTIFAKVVGTTPTKPTLLRRALAEAAEDPPRKAAPWILADKRIVDDNSIQIHLGRTAKRRIPKLTTTGHFVREDTDVAPYTNVLVDFPLELCAVAPNAELAPSPDRLASAIAQILSATSVAETYGVSFKASPLKGGCPESCRN
jgi:hypothetical protein